jgi:hypothetical protein
MGPFSAAVLIAAFEGLKWLLGLTSGLFVLLTVVQAVRGDADARPVTTVAMAVAFAAAALLCRWLGARVEAWARRG